MKYLMLFVDNFEDTEAIATMDVLKRGKDEVIGASLMKRTKVLAKFGFEMNVNDVVENLPLDEFDALIIPGGPGSFQIMPTLPIVTELIHYFVKNNKLVAAICAAPHLVGRLGYLKDKNYTVHPGFESMIVGGNYQRDKGVVRDGNFITAKSMYYSIEFGLAIHEYFHGHESMEALRKACMGEK